MGSKEIKKKIEETNLKRYGNKVPARTKEVRAKTGKTNVERYGTKSTLQNSTVLQKYYNVDRIQDIPEILEKINSNRKKSI